MTSVERLNKIIEELENTPFFTNDQLENVYLGLIAEFLAKIADALDDIKSQKAE